jgi:two-component system alkaline phosphatase synthesis response regulator PhoP/two-component system response regulator VicR
MSATVPKILVVDDEPAIVRVVRDELAFEGFEVQTASDGPAALARAREWQPSVMLLDVMLPGVNGFDVCRELRRDLPGMWIIMLTVRSQEVDRVRGLELGADDYVAKPFSLRELVARVKVGLRREGTAAPASVTFGDVEVELRAHRVRRRGAPVRLARKEFQMLALLVQRAGEVITREEFLDTIWGRNIYVTPRTVDTHMATLRKKLEPDPEHPKFLVGVRGVGYRFDGDLTEQ